METKTAQIQKKLQVELDSFKATQKGKFETFANFT